MNRIELPGLSNNAFAVQGANKSVVHHFEATKYLTNVTAFKKVLYADDDLDDKVWVSEACKALNCALNIEFVENGRQVMDYLERHNTNGLPGLIVLDLNMPELDGRQTLKRLKDNDRYKTIPVVIVTTSQSKVDREVCTRLGASLFLSKPNTHAEWQLIVQQLEPFVA